jgi:DNA polymerase-3 subunit chi
VRFLVEGASMPGDVATYQRLVVLFDGEDPEALEEARARWSKSKEQGFEVTYWLTDKNGRWQRQA